MRARWEARLADVGVAALHGELARAIAEAAASILPTDGRRIVRALEVVELTGRPFAASAPTIGEPRWDTVIIGLDWETATSRRTAAAAHRRDVRRRSGRRGRGTARARPARGRHRVPGPGLRAGARGTRATGEADAAIAEARERTFIGTRRYVRRQRSWFRRDHRIRWLDGSGRRQRRAPPRHPPTRILNR